MRFNPTTPVAFYVKKSEYVQGQGAESQWKQIGLLYCEWRGTFGDRATAAQAVGVSESATVRTFYHPDIYEALRGSHVLIAKNADITVLKDGTPIKSNPNAYMLWGGVDNVAEENQYIEFKVKRYEDK